MKHFKFKNNFMKKLLNKISLENKRSLIVGDFDIFLNYHEHPCISGNWTAYISDHLSKFIIVENLLENIIDRSDDQMEHRNYKNF